MRLHGLNGLFPRIGTLAFAAGVLLSATLSASGFTPSQRPAANALDAQLLEIMRERTRLWLLPKGGTREVDVSSLVCPLITAEALDDLFQANNENVDYVPDGGFPSGSQLWRIKGDVIDPITVSMVAIWLGPGERCDAQFSLTL